MNECFTCLATTSLAVPSTFSGTLNVTSPAFIRPDGYSYEYYFYQALQFNVSIAESYTFTSSSGTFMSTFGCLYQTSFDPSNSCDNLIAYDDASTPQSQFLFTSTLQSGEVYILVVTTSAYSDTGV